MVGRRLPLTLAAALAVTVLAAGCGGTAATPASAPAATPAAAPAATSQPAAPAKPLTKVDVRFDFLVGGQDAGYVVAAADGYYKDVGLDVRLEQGKGSAVTVDTVANGSDTFGGADAGTAALAISKGVPIKELAVTLQQTPFAFVYRKSMAFTSPKDLIGKPIITTAGSAENSILPAILDKYGIKPSQLELQYVQTSAEPAAFAKEADAVLLGFDNGDYLRAQALVPSAIYKTYGQFGVDLYSVGVITSLTELKDHPGVVRRFMSATARGWKAVQADPKAAVSDILKAFPDNTRALQAESLKITLQSLHTPATQGHPWGWMAKSDWQSTIGLLHKYDNMQHVKPLSDYYTNAYLPAS